MVLSIAVPSPEEPDDALTERHWAYMDGFAHLMTARGPLLGPDRATWTGSLHVVDLPSGSDALQFAENEPYHQARRYASHHICRFDNLLGARTMWDHPRRPDEPYFLLLSSRPVDLPPERVLVHGALSQLGGDGRGFLTAVQVPDRAHLGDLDPGEVEVLDWEPGGRR